MNSDSSAVVAACKHEFGEQIKSTIDKYKVIKTNRVCANKCTFSYHGIAVNSVFEILFQSRPMTTVVASLKRKSRIPVLCSNCETFFISDPNNIITIVGTEWCFCCSLATNERYKWVFPNLLLLREMQNRILLPHGARNFCKN